MTKATSGVDGAGIVKDERLPHESMAIVEKYEAFLNYAYPKIQNCPRKHGVVRDVVLRALAEPVAGFYAAGKSGQVSRLYQLDADLAAIRFWLRFLASPDRRVISQQQQATALRHLAEVGRMLGAWIGKKTANDKASTRSAPDRHTDGAFRSSARPGSRG